MISNNYSSSPSFANVPISFASAKENLNANADRSPFSKHPITKDTVSFRNSNKTPEIKFTGRPSPKMAAEKKALLEYFQSLPPGTEKVSSQVADETTICNEGYSNRLVILIRRLEALQQEGHLIKMADKSYKLK